MNSNYTQMKKYNLIKSLFYLSIIIAFFACKKNDVSTPTPSMLMPDTAIAGDMLTLKGSGLSDVRNIIFEKDSVPAFFNPVFNTDNALLFRVPDTASGGKQNIIFVKGSGATFTMPIFIKAFPSVTGVSNYNFVPGAQITLTGNNLEDVSAVVTADENTNVTIVSHTKKEVVLQMPAVSAGRVKLNITNASGTITTTQEFVNINNAYQIFTDDFKNGFVNGSWGPAQVSSSVSKTGTASFAMTYMKGNWSADGFANWSGGLANLEAQGYQYLTFWIRGGSSDHIYYLTADQRPAGYGNADMTTPLEVPANVWTYFKLPLSSLKLWSKGGNLQQLGWYIRGPEDADQTIYIDDVIFIK